ncbi:MAG: serine protease [Planctomycetota bacterium]|jgi:serine protease
MNRTTYRCLLLLPITVSAVACSSGSGGGSAPPPVVTATLTGELRMPEVAPTSAGSSTAALSPMVGGEVVVWFEEGKGIQDLDTRMLDTDGFELVRPATGPMAVFHARRADGKSSLRDGATEADCIEKATCDAADAMAAIAGVRCASPNYMLQAFTNPSDTHYDKQWHYPQIKLPQAWDVTQGSQNVIVAVLDTGIVSSHPDFSGRLIGGFDMISNPQTAGDGDGRDGNPEDVGDNQTLQGSSFHGTHVAGTIGANANNGIGVVGVDWNCRLMTVRVLGQGGGSIDDIANGILYAAGLPNGSGAVPPQRADVINMSLGGPGLNAVLEQACNQAAAAGVLLVAAAGNDNSSQPSSPAAFESVLSVGAVDLVKQRAPYSNFSPTVDIWAPGGDMGSDRNGDGFPDGVLSTMADDQGNLFYKFENGTSMASPHIAGVASLIKAANPNLTASQIRQILINSAETGLSLPNAGRLVDALASVQAAAAGQGNPPSSPVLVASQTVADFGAEETTLSIALRNEGIGNLTFISIATNLPAAWLNGNVVDVDPNNNVLGDQLDLIVDRLNVIPGVEQATLTLNYEDASSNPVSVDIIVRLQVGASTVADDTVFVLLVDALTLEALYQTETRVGANFNFSMGGVASGTYLLVAGTDRDNDDFLGDEGELFGAYPSIDTPLPVAVIDGQGPGDLDFALQELVTVQSLGASSPARRTFRLRN